MVMIKHVLDQYAYIKIITLDLYMTMKPKRFGGFSPWILWLLQPQWLGTMHADFVRSGKRSQRLNRW